VLLVDITSSGWGSAIRQAGDVSQLIDGFLVDLARPSSRACPGLIGVTCRSVLFCPSRDGGGSMRLRWWLGLGAAAVVLVMVAVWAVTNRDTASHPNAAASAAGTAGVDPEDSSPSGTASPAPSASSASAKPGVSPSVTPAPGSGVYFQDVADVRAWSNYPQHPQKAGIIRNVATPSYRGGGAIEARQTYQNEGGGYHSEVIRTGVETIGQDRYFGQAIYLAPDWQFTSQSVTFQQFSPENPEGPWLLMIIENEGIRLGGSGGIGGPVGKITNLRGTWIRIVVRIKLAESGGAVEAWFNGVKTLSLTNRAVLPKTATSIRWSSGIYCNSWRTEQPVGPTQISVFHSRARIASSYPLAEPANW
jgi:hypothetical protein